jgi:hypothetical protein
MNIVRNKEPKMEQLTSWEEMTTVEQYAGIHWDMYKDAFGIRPRGIDTSSWTEADYLAEFKQLEEIIEREDIARKAAEATSLEKFERRVAELLNTGAKDYEMAMRWIHEAEDTNGDNDYLAWTLGLPYRYFTQKEIA